jgi:hypothetical protein
VRLIGADPLHLILADFHFLRLLHSYFRYIIDGNAILYFTFLLRLRNLDLRFLFFDWRIVFFNQIVSHYSFLYFTPLLFVFEHSLPSDPPHEICLDLLVQINRLKVVDVGFN